MSDISSGFPKPLAFNFLKRLQGNFSKNNIKIIPDNQTAQPDNVIRLKVGGNGLFDFRSFQLMMTGTCKQDNVGANDYRIHFPRYGGSSLIQDMVITANNTTLFSCKDYNFLYNAIHDLEASDISQYAKRNSACENYDPSIAFGVSSYTETDGGANQTLSAIPAMLSTAPSDTNMPLCVNNWLFFNSLSVSTFFTFNFFTIHTLLLLSFSYTILHSFICNFRVPSLHQCYRLQVFIKKS